MEFRRTRNMLLYIAFHYRLLNLSFELTGKYFEKKYQ